MLKERNGSSAMVRFEKAHMLARYTGEKVQQRRAVRGLAAAARLQGQHKSAIEHLKQVLKLSKQMDDHVGDADAYGTIADSYTDLGEFEKVWSLHQCVTVLHSAGLPQEQNGCSQKQCVTILQRAPSNLLS